MCGCRPLLIAGIVLLPHLASTGSAQRSSARALKAKGLVKQGSHYYVLPAEENVNKRLRSLEKGTRRKKLEDAEREVQAARTRADQIRSQEWLAAVNEQRQLAQRLRHAEASGAPASERSRLKIRNNSLTGRVRDLAKEFQTLGKRIEVLEQTVAQAREAYVQALVDLRALVDKTLRQYALLANDADVKAALEKLNKYSRTRKGVSLGPSSLFQKDIKKLEELEKPLMSQTIELQPSGGGTFLIDTIVNEQHRVTMTLDTGAGAVVLPKQIAGQVGWEPAATDQSGYGEQADGRRVPVTVSTLSSVRVGKFKVKSVGCVVLPGGTRGATPLLGQSFLKHFSYQIAPGGGKLTLRKLGGSAETTPPPPQPQRQPQGKRRGQSRSPRR